MASSLIAADRGYLGNSDLLVVLVKVLGDLVDATCEDTQVVNLLYLQVLLDQLL